MDELSELIRDSILVKEGMKKLGDKSHDILSEIYATKTHFITELLQNAEDEGAKNVEFKLTEDCLEFLHDSKKLFDINDIKAICNFGGNNRKKEKPNAIGRFGIGFKSVDSITDRPRIISADFDITITEKTIPNRTKPNNLNPSFFQGTRIILPFKEDKKQETFEILNKELENLKIEWLLFLSNIQSIKFNDFIYERVQDKKDHHLISLNKNNNKVYFFLLDKLVKIDDKELSIKIAFLLDEKRKITRCNQSTLFVFFPTTIDTRLEFLVHGPFYTTPARDNIQKDYRNEQLQKELGILLAESLSVFKKLKLLNVELLKILPINYNNCLRSPIYNQLYNSVKKEFADNKLLIPNTNGGFSSAKDSMLLGSPDLADIIFEKQARSLFGRSTWVSKGISSSPNTSELYLYLKNSLGIPEKQVSDFATKIDESFMLEQTDEDIIKYYKVFLKSEALWKKDAKNPILRIKPIIRVENNEKRQHVAPFQSIQSNAKPNVFLPTKENTAYTIVKKNIAKNQEARKFLSDIGLTEPDLFAEINDFVIPKLRKKVLYPDYFKDFEKIMVALQSTNHEKESRLSLDLRDIPFILGINHITKKTSFFDANEIYFPSDILKMYFEGNEEVYFFADDQYGGLAKYQKILEKIGVRKLPRKKQKFLYLSYEEKLKLRYSKNNTGHESCTDYELEGLEHFLNNQITFEKSIVLWKLLIQCSTIYNSANPYFSENFFKAEYKYENRGEHTRYIDSYFLNQLITKKWLIDTHNNNALVKPTEISFSELPDEYKTNLEYFQEFLKILKFKPDEIRDIEQKTGGIFISKEEKEEYDKFKKWKSEQKKPAGTLPTVSDNKNNDTPPKPEEKKFEPECKPEEANLNSKEFAGAQINKKFQSGNSGAVNPNVKETNKTESPIEKLSQEFLKDIGEWGQDYVLRELQKEFGGDSTFSINDLNTDGKVGVGCDFEVTKNSEIFRLVEVKSTRFNIGTELYISGTQWEIARSYFNESDGDKYWVYCVFNAGETNAEIVKIKNPIKMWKEGTLYAHPVDFIVK